MHILFYRFRLRVNSKNLRIQRETSAYKFTISHLTPESTGNSVKNSFDHCGKNLYAEENPHHTQVQKYDLP